MTKFTLFSFLVKTEYQDNHTSAYLITLQWWIGGGALWRLKTPPPLHLTPDLTHRDLLSRSIHILSLSNFLTYI